MKEIDLFNEHWVMNEITSSMQLEKASILLKFMGMTPRMECTHYFEEFPYIRHQAADETYGRSFYRSNAEWLIVNRREGHHLSYDELIHNIKLTLNGKANNNQGVNKQV